MRIKSLVFNLSASFAGGILIFGFLHSFSIDNLETSVSSIQTTETTVLATPSGQTSKNPPLLTVTPENLYKYSLPVEDRQTKCGHYKYSVATPTELEKVKVEGGEIKVQPVVKDAWLEMTEASKSEGYNLILIDGYRTYYQQSELFSNQINRKGSIEEACKWSAPKGHSEHHTGYAIDVSDGDSTKHLKLSFADSDLYQWLTTNASTYGFELSFPEGNTQGVSFEPWHWRYIGDNKSKNLFSK